MFCCLDQTGRSLFSGSMLYNLLTSQQQPAGLDMQSYDRHLQTPELTEHLTFDQTRHLTFFFFFFPHQAAQAPTHGQRDAASSQDLPVGLPDASAGVLQVVHVHVHVPDIGHHEGLIRRRPGAAVVGPQQGRLHPDVTGPEPVVVQFYRLQ